MDIEPGDFANLVLKAAIAWLAPSGSINCSRNSTLVLPLTTNNNVKVNRNRRKLIKVSKNVSSWVSLKMSLPHDALACYKTLVISNKNNHLTYLYKGRSFEGMLRVVPNRPQLEP